MNDSTNEFDHHNNTYAASKNFKIVLLGLQHVLVLYAGAIAVPLIIGRALNLTPGQISILVSADLFACGVVTILQSLRIKPFFGIGLPVMMGVTFIAVGPMLAIAYDPLLGDPVDRLRVIFGSAIAAGLFGILVAPFLSRLIPFFPPVVTGTIILVIGVSLMRVGINWSAGSSDSNAAEYGDPFGLAIALFVIIVILLISKSKWRFFANISVLMGIIIGSTACLLIFQTMNLTNIHSSDWFGFVYPFQFGAPIFNPAHIFTMCIAMLVIMIESAGMFLALGTITNCKLTRDDLARGFRTDSLGAIIGGVMNTFPYTSYAQNVGLVAITRVHSRWVTVAGGCILIALGWIPKLGALAEAIPLYVLGGAAIVMFGMVATTGIRILSTVDLENNRYNLLIVSLSLGVGLIPVLAPKFFDQLVILVPFLKPLVHSGIILATVTAILMNLFLNRAQYVGASIGGEK